MRYNNDPFRDKEVRAFIQAMRNGYPIEHGSIIDAYQTMCLVDKIYRADKT